MLCPFSIVCRYFSHESALDAVAFLNQTQLDGRIIRVELDFGYTKARRWGRGESGGQVRGITRADMHTGFGRA